MQRWHLGLCHGGVCFMAFNHTCAVVAAERKNGMAALPECCHPDLTQPCGKCGAVSWQLSHKVSSLVFLRGTPVKADFAAYSCRAPGCDGMLDADGIEVGVVRQMPQLAFGHDLLYAWPTP
jgi:hypothetical protein